MTEFAAAGVGHEKVGHTGQGLWKHKGWQLPAYIQHVANDLIQSGKTESEAIRLAVGIIRNWAAGHDGKGGTVKPDTQAKAAAALAEWEALKTKAGKSKGKKTHASGYLAASVLSGVELARPGKWKLSTGDCEFTDAMLRDAADYFAATGAQGVPIGFGHNDPRFDGDPAFGRLTNVHYAVDDRGPVLRGDLTDMTDWLAAAAPKRWPFRSIEGLRNFEYRGRTYGLALTRLALLGATPPAIMDLKSLQEAVAAAAATGGEWITARPAEAPPEEPQPTGPGPGQTWLSDDEAVDYLSSTLTPPADPPPDEPAPVPAPGAVPHTLPEQGTGSSPLLENQPPAPLNQEGAGMDPAKLREAVGLKPDASDQDVVAALAAGGLKVAASAPPVPPTPPTPPAPDTPPVPDPTPKPQQGVVQIDASQLAEFQRAAREMQTIKARLQQNERDEVIAAAVRAGKFPQSRIKHWETSWDADPVGAKLTIESLQANLVPIAASGYMGDPDAEFEADFSGMFPPELKGAGRG